MKRRYRHLLNLCSLALLAVALYLTFLKKETPEFTPAGALMKQASGAVSDNPIESSAFDGKQPGRTAAVK